MYSPRSVMIKKRKKTNRRQKTKSRWDSRAEERRGGKGPTRLPEERSSRKGTVHHITAVTTSPALHS
jgi:hypothetical protein